MKLSLSPRASLLLEGIKSILSPISLTAKHYLKKVQSFIYSKSMSKLLATRFDSPMFDSPMFTSARLRQPGAAY